MRYSIYFESYRKSVLLYNWRQTVIHFFISGEKQGRSLYILLMEFHRLKYHLLVTKKDKILSSSGLTRTHRLSPCSHKEADTRGPAHLQDIVLHDHSVISMRTVDTDWILIALVQIHYLNPRA